MKTYKTCESVRIGHPDKLCDFIADFILDSCLEVDPDSRVACEVMATGGKIIVAGEITCELRPYIESDVKKALQICGYSPDDFRVFVNCHRQSKDIASGVSNSLEERNGCEDRYSSLGAGDQGTVYGYATNETEEMLPLPLVLAHNICREIDIFREQTDRRDRLKKDWKTLLDEILQKISENKYRYPEVEQKLLLLSDKLSRTKGKKVYGYLKRDVKDLIDSIVDLLAEDENISRLYDLWYEKKYEILRTYTSEMPPKIPLSQNKEFKSIKNDIIREAMKLHEDSGQTETNPPKKQSQTQAPQKISPTVSATAVTRLFKNLCGIFQNKLDDRRQSSQPTIDKRQKKEIEEKRNAEMSML